jgi:hypothetical protein
MALLLALAALCAPGAAEAYQGDSRATLFVGTTRFMASDASTYGTTFGFSWGYEVIDDLLWSFGAAATTTDGTVTSAGQKYPISAQTTTEQTGLTYYFNRSPTSLLIPFVGGGFSLMQYDIDYTFPDSQVGKTSGSGAGAFANAGLEIWFSRATTLILQYQAAAHEVRTQSGKTILVDSGGLLLSLRIGIRV